MGLRMKNRRRRSGNQRQERLERQENRGNANLERRSANQPSRRRSRIGPIGPNRKTADVIGRTIKGCAFLYLRIVALQAGRGANFWFSPFRFSCLQIYPRPDFRASGPFFRRTNHRPTAGTKATHPSHKGLQDAVVTRFGRFVAVKTAKRPIKRAPSRTYAYSGKPTRFSTMLVYIGIKVSQEKSFFAKMALDLAICGHFGAG